MMLVTALSMRLQTVANVSRWQPMLMAAQVDIRIHNPLVDKSRLIPHFLSISMVSVFMI